MAGVKGRSGGARPNSGPKPKPPQLITSAELLTSSPAQFLTALMNDPGADIKIRADAAKALLAAELRKADAKGKKEQKQEDAEKVASRFAPAAPPKLVAAGGRKV